MFQHKKYIYYTIVRIIIYGNKTTIGGFNT